MMRVGACVCVVTALLAAPGRAQDNCTEADTGTLSGVPGVHTEMLLPGQLALRLPLPPVCAKQNGVHALACDAAGAPSLELRARSVQLLRRAAAGFAMLSVTLYCAPPLHDPPADQQPVKPTVKPSEIIN